MRRGPSLKRKPEADPLFNSVLVSQLTNQVLLDGKKDTARNIVYKALELVEKQARELRKRKAEAQLDGFLLEKEIDQETREEASAMIDKHQK